MLYKKYHRNFVKQFRIGTRFEFTWASGERQIKRNPICKGNIIIVYWGESVDYDLCLMYADGTLADDVEVL